MRGKRHDPCNARHRTDARPAHRRRLARRALDAVHRQPQLQGRSAHDRGGQGRLLHRRRRPQDLRRPLGPVVLGPWPWPPRNHRGGEPPDRQARLLARVPVRPSALFRAGQQDQGAHARGAGLRVLHRLGLRSRRHLAEDGARLLAHQGPRQQDAPDRPRKGLPRRQLRRHFGGRHCGQPQAVRPRASKRTTCRTRRLRPTLSRAACRRTAPSWPTACST